MLHFPLVATLAAALSTAPPLPDAAAILAKVEAKLGSSPFRTNPEVIEMKGAMVIPGMPRIPHEQLFVGSERVKYSSRMGEFGTQTQGTTPEFAWSTDPAAGITVKEGSDRLGVARGYAIERRAPWQAVYSSATTLAVIDFEGRKHFDLEMTPADPGPKDHWYVDCDSYLPTGFATALPDPQGGAIAVTFVFSDWEETGGILFPYRKAMRVGDVRIEFEFETIQMTLVDDAFLSRVAPPENVLAARQDPARQSTQAGAHGVCSVERVEEKKALGVRLTVPEAEVSKHLAIMYQEIMTYATAQKLVPIAPPFARIHSRSEGRVDLEGGMQFAKTAPGEGRVKPTVLPAGRAAMTWHVGPYHDLPKTCDLLSNWMKEQALTPAGGPWEIYWTDPGIEPDASKWRTQIYWPITD